MNWPEIARNWSTLVPAVMQQWPEAAESDLLALDGSRDALAGYLSQVTGRDYADIQDEISEWREGAMPADLRMDESEDMQAISASGKYVPVGEDPSDDDAAFGDDDQPATPIGRKG
ncbi:hypothetical protein SAMN06297129_2301 [Pseudooceanicola antarcticus]|uniref:Uncharacterized protein n=1 Tax=Pseudooceanicola antarcticus TaxID=1247613 RepID=A0A285IZ96_9RHOB|nr:hypothetical protein [Pseudooceanicola antarcticus]PJE25901.1 hypothetical protein CVM39_19570 [Pseudooceanicola antarcticus]SNY52426.1 hypothetical protein SAMN06297129_2301 [Pseudooceanicola antarcticus]